MYRARLSGRANELTLRASIWKSMTRPASVRWATRTPVTLSDGAVCGAQAPSDAAMAGAIKARAKRVRSGIQPV